MQEFEIKDEYIELMKLLKAAGICDTGGQAKLLIDNDLIQINGKAETRRRFKVKKGMIVSYQDISINVI